jgi:hypothetical protein
MWTRNKYLKIMRSLAKISVTPSTSVKHVLFTISWLELDFMLHLLQVNILYLSQFWVLLDFVLYFKWVCTLYLKKKTCLVEFSYLIHNVSAYIKHATDFGYSMDAIMCMTWYYVLYLSHWMNNKKVVKLINFPLNLKKKKIILQMCLWIRSLEMYLFQNSFAICLTRIKALQRLYKINTNLFVF